MNFIFNLIIELKIYSRNIDWHCYYMLLRIGIMHVRINIISTSIIYICHEMRWKQLLIKYSLYLLLFLQFFHHLVKYISRSSIKFKLGSNSMTAICLNLISAMFILIYHMIIENKLIPCINLSFYLFFIYNNYDVY